MFVCPYIYIYIYIYKNNNNRHISIEIIDSEKSETTWDEYRQVINSAHNL